MWFGPCPSLWPQLLARPPLFSKPQPHWFHLSFNYLHLWNLLSQKISPLDLYMACSFSIQVSGQMLLQRHLLQILLLIPPPVILYLLTISFFKLPFLICLYSIICLCLLVCDSHYSRSWALLFIALSSAECTKKCQANSRVSIKLTELIIALDTEDIWKSIFQFEYHAYINTH